jgi:5-methyltetrahydropteroyltriglutamate--homocysteine methyltransferase
VPLEHIIDLILEVKAQTYSFEAANVRHEHEWRIWQNVKLPAGKMLMPGVVSHATNLVEHPQLVADRILRYAEIAGRENVIAGTDCASAVGCTPTSPGPSCTPWLKVRASHRRASGPD